MTAPASRFQRFLSRHASTATMERLVDPILTDMRIEASAATARGQHWASRRIRAAGTIALIRALALYAWTQFWSIGEWPVEDRRAVARSMAYAFVVTAAGIKVLLLPPLLRFPIARYQELALYLVPQAVPVALPVGLFIGLLYGFRSSVPSLRSRTLVTAVAIVCSISSFVALAWIVPVSNQAFRVAALEDRFVTKGAPEMTLRELRTRITAETTKGRTAPGLAHHYHFRWALAAAPLVLAAWALLIVPRLPDRRWVAGIVAVASSVGYYTLIDAGRVGVINGALPPIAGAWLANAAFVAALVLLARRTSNARTTNGAV